MKRKKNSIADKSALPDFPNNAILS